MSKMASLSSPPPPTALLLDMDGVLAEVSQSYRAAILNTCSHFLGREGVVTTQAVSARKAAGGCNNDWVLSRDLIAEHWSAQGGDGACPSLAEVTARFELLYQGDGLAGGDPGLASLESLIPCKGLLRELRRRCPARMAVVTGRPRSDCLFFLRLHGLESLFDALVCMEDCPPKPSPQPVLLACSLLGVSPSSAVLAGDTPDDVRAALAAGCRAVAVATPNEWAEATLGRRSVAEGGTLAGACVEAGAERLLEPGLAGLLDLFESP